MRILYDPGTVFSDAPSCTNDTHYGSTPSNVPSYASSATLLWTSSASYDTPSGTMETLSFSFELKHFPQVKSLSPISIWELACSHLLSRLSSAGICSLGYETFIMYHMLSLAYKVRHSLLLFCTYDFQLVSNISPVIYSFFASSISFTLANMLN